MIARYTTLEMAPVWTDKTKFQTWLDVELAMAQARCNLGIYQPEIIVQIRKALHPQEFMTDEIVAAIHARDKEIEHNLQAFVDVVRAHLPSNLQHFLHEEMTSYDTEVPALALQFNRAGVVIIRRLDELIHALRILAGQHAWTFCMGISHGQDAKPTTFGWRVCSYLEMMEGAREGLASALGKIRLVKCSGAVGNYDTISPELEVEVCRLLGLEVRRAATQIVARDVFANLLAQIAITGGCLEKMATDLRLLATSAYGEIREPRKEKQKGSSAMPHKRNPVILERVSGMAIALRGYAAMGQELIRTWLERDIAHSSVERIALADATTLLDYMLQKMAWVVKGLEVNRQRMAENINRTFGCWASEDVKDLLGKKGFAPEDVYYFLQQCAFDALRLEMPYRDVLLITVFPGTNKPLVNLVSTEEVDKCFNFRERLEQNLPKAYERFSLYSSEIEIMEPNITQ